MTYIKVTTFTHTEHGRQQLEQVRLKTLKHQEVMIYIAFRTYRLYIMLLELEVDQQHTNNTTTNDRNGRVGIEHELKCSCSIPASRWTTTTAYRVLFVYIVENFVRWKEYHDFEKNGATIVLISCTGDVNPYYYCVRLIKSCGFGVKVVGCHGALWPVHNSW